MLPSRREAKRLAQPPPVRWAQGVRATALVSWGRRRLVALEIAGMLLVSMLVTAVRLGDPAGVVAIVILAFLTVLMVNPGDFRRRFPGFSARSAWPTGLSLAAYVIVAGLVYGAVAQWLPAGAARPGGGVAGPKEAGPREAGGGRSQVTVTSPAEPAFEAMVIRVAAPNRLIIDGEEVVELEAVPEVAADDPAFKRVVADLTALTAGKLVTVVVHNPGPPPAGSQAVWRARVTLSGPSGEGAVVVNESAVQALARSGSTVSTGSGTVVPTDPAGGAGKASPKTGSKNPPEQ